MAKRKVQFYRANCGIDASGELLPFDVSPVCRDVHKLAFTENERYLDERDGNVLCCWIEHQGRPQHVTLGVVRRGNLPQVEEGGNRSALAIPATAGIVEATHFVLFPNNIVGMLFNFYGPRPRKLAYYFKQRSDSTPRDLRVEALLRSDVLDELDGFQAVRVLELTIHRSFINRLVEADQSLHAAFEAAERMSSADRLELVLRPAPRKREWLNQRLLRTVRSLARLPGLREEVAKFKITGMAENDESIQTLDVLRDRFVVDVDVAVEEGSSRTVVPQSAFRAIEEAYSDLRDDLLQAAVSL